MIETSLHSNILTAILGDPTDRNFISMVRSYIDSIKEPTEDERCTQNFLKTVIAHNITTQDELIYNLSSEDYSDKLIESVLYDVSYSQHYKQSLLSKLNMQKTVTKFVPLRDEMDKCLAIMDRDGGNKRGENALKTLIELSNEIQRTAQNIRLGSSLSNICILDPRSEGEEDIATYVELAKAVEVSKKNCVKTIPPIDNMWGVGAVPGSLYLMPGISGKGKSLMMQNLTLYACKNNKVEDLVTGDLQPCSVFFSYEMDRRQCMERTLSWLGMPEPVQEDDETIVDYAKKLKRCVSDGFKKLGIHIPVIYIEQKTDGGVELPDAGSVEMELENLKNSGLYPIFVTVDYLDRMDLRNKRLRAMGESGAEGAAKTRLKARELRDVAKRLQVPILTGTQMDADAMAKSDRIEPYMRMFDVLLEFGISNVAGSKNLRAEVEGIVMVQQFNIVTKTIGTDEVITKGFVAVKEEKDRDGKSRYKYSKRDKENFSAYQSYTNQLKNSAKRDLLKFTSKAHAVIPMEGFRVSDEDWGQSIRMFYPSESSDFVSMSHLIQTTMQNVALDELEERMDEMFDIDFVSDEERNEIMEESLQN